jgi:hypothetical protein
MQISGPFLQALHFLWTKTPVWFKNLKSVLSNPEGARLKIESEIIAGRIVGPFDTKCWFQVHFSKFHIFSYSLNHRNCIVKKRVFNRSIMFIYKIIDTICWWIGHVCYQPNTIEEKFYIDKCMSMGCSISCATFERFSTFLHWVIENKSGTKNIDHYLDDILFNVHL